MDDPTFACAHELAATIRSREVSSAEVVDAHLARIERYNARLNALVTLDEGGKWRVTSVTGPMARSVEDLRLALRLITGPDGIDPEVPPVPRREPAPTEMRDLRIAWSSAFPESTTQDEIRAAVEGVARELAGRGLTVGERLPDVDLRRQYELGEELFGLVAGAFEEDAEHPSLDAYLEALDRRDKVMAAWDEFFDGWDALVAPAGTRTAERHEEEGPEPSEEYPYRLSALSGCPLVVIPAGWTARDYLSTCKSWVAAGTTSGYWRSPSSSPSLRPDFAVHPVTELFTQVRSSALGN